jgi:hypothetical protein
MSKGAKRIWIIARRRNSHSPALSLQRKEGQAIVEFIVGLVVVLVLFAGLLQVASLAKAHTETMTEARRRAAIQATMDFDIPSTPDYILSRLPGADNKDYTRDDSFTPANAGDFENLIIEQAAENTAGWDLINSVPGNRVSTLRGSAAPVTQFGLVKGSDSESVDLLPAVQNLIYDAPHIELKCDVWMTQTKGLY